MSKQNAGEMDELVIRYPLPPPPPATCYAPRDRTFPSPGRISRILNALMMVPEIIQRRFLFIAESSQQSSLCIYKRKHTFWKLNILEFKN